MGGTGGLVASTLPILVLMPVNARYGLTPALAAALAVALAIAVWRIVRKENLQPAISGLFGVAIGAALAYGTGSAKGYFLYGIWMSLLFGIVFLVSLFLRWPMVGVIWRGINGEGMAWQKNPPARRLYAVATVAWALVFFARFIVQNWLYSVDRENALAVAKILMGWPLTGLALIVTVWAVRRAGRIMDPGQKAENG